MRGFEPSVLSVATQVTDIVYKIRTEYVNTVNVLKSKFDPTRASKTWEKSRLLRYTPSKLDTPWHLKTPNQ